MITTAVQEVARDAQRLLRMYGWTKGRWRAKEGQICLDSALEWAVTRYPGRRYEPDLLKDARLEVAQVIMEQFPERRHWLWRWTWMPAAYFNDCRATTFADVQLVLEKVACD